MKSDLSPWFSVLAVWVVLFSAMFNTVAALAIAVMILVFIASYQLSRHTFDHKPSKVVLLGAILGALLMIDGVVVYELLQGHKRNNILEYGFLIFSIVFFASINSFLKDNRKSLHTD